jgi:hypothetical protein
LISWLKNTVMDGYFLSFRRCCTPYVGIHFFTKKAESTGAILFRRSPQWVNLRSFGSQRCFHHRSMEESWDQNISFSTGLPST